MSSLSDRLRDILDERNLTVYGASQVIAAETDEPLKTINERLRRYLQRPPESWQQIEEALNVLGYEIKITPKQ